MALPTALPVDRFFTEAVRTASSYPRNLLHQATYTATLSSYQQKINTADTVFEPEPQPNAQSKANIPIHDLHQTLQVASNTAANQNIGGFTKTEVTTLQQLRDLEGVRTSAANNDIEIYKRDPKCRVVFLWADHGRDRLKITKDMLRELLTFHQVMPGYLDLLFLFGSSVGPNDLKFSAFREQISLRTASIGCDDIYRSGQQYELCYNLKTIRRKDIAANITRNLPARVEWGAKQAAVYHKFDIKFGTTVWLFTRASLDLQTRFVEVTGPQGRAEDHCFDTPEECFRSSLAMHAFMIHWASENWAQRLQYSDVELERTTKDLVSGDRKPGPDRKVYTARDLQTLHKQCDAINEAILAIEGNVEVVEAILTFYKELIEDVNFTLAHLCRDYVDTFLKQSKNAVYDLKMQISRAKALAATAAERKNLMIHYINAQVAEKQEDLTNSTYEVTISAEREAILMRIITIVTLLFLPATFVSTFFSAPLINFGLSDASDSSGNGNGNNINNNSSDNYNLALHRWLEITVPLTVVTVVGAIATYVIERNRRQKQREREKLKNYV